MGVFIISIIVIAVISVLLSVISLKKMGNKSDIDKVKKELARGKVIFKEDYSSSKSSSS